MRKTTKGQDMRLSSSCYLLFALAVFFLVLPVTASIPTVIVTEYTVTPSVMIPGEEGIINVIVKNTAEQATFTQSYGYDTGATTTSVDINAPIDSITLFGKGIEVIGGGYQRVGELGPGQSIPISFHIRAPPEPGIYFPEVWIRVTEAKSLKYPIPVNVNSEVQIQKKPQISIAKQLPASVIPGENFIATVVVTNTGQLPASNLQVTVNSSTTSLSSKTPGTLHIDRLGQGENRTLVMEFATDRKAPLGIQPVSLVLDYQEPDGSYQRQLETLGINIRGKAELAISQITTDPARIQQGDQFSLIIRLENTGTDDAKSVSARIEIPIPGSKEAFVGKIEPGNDAPAPFNLQADRSGEIPYTLTILYEDDHGTAEERQDLHLTIYSQDRTGLIAGLFLLVLAGGFGYWYFIHRKKGTGNA
jgi:hypothetical protein